MFCKAKREFFLMIFGLNLYGLKRWGGYPCVSKVISYSLEETTEN